MLSSAIAVIILVSISSVCFANDARKLLMTAYNNDFKAVRVLIQNGTPVDTKDHYGKTILMWAVINENLDMARYLISRGADVNARDVEGTTPLMWAVVTGNAGTVKLLIEKNADIHAKDVYGKTALRSSTERGLNKISMLLKVNGAKQ